MGHPVEPPGVPAPGVRSYDEVQRRVRVHPRLRVVDLPDVKVGEGRAALVLVLTLPEGCVEGHQDLGGRRVRGRPERAALLRRHRWVEVDGGRDRRRRRHQDVVAVVHWTKACLI